MRFWRAILPFTSTTSMPPWPTLRNWRTRHVWCRSGSVKFKLDENLPAELVANLRNLGHDADTVSDEGLRGAQDPVVMTAAFAADRILFTLHKGIANLQRYPTQPTRWGGFVPPRDIGERRCHRVCAGAATQSARDGPNRSADGRRRDPYPDSIGSVTGPLDCLISRRGEGGRSAELRRREFGSGGANRVYGGVTLRCCKKRCRASTDKAYVGIAGLRRVKQGGV